MAADDEQHDARDDAHGAFGAVHQAVRAEAAVARERAAGDERDEVADDRGEEPDEQQALAVEQRVHDRLLEREPRATTRARREHRAEHGGPLHERTAADAAGAAVRDARAPTSCSSGWNRPGVTTNTIAQRLLSAA